ncbi:hypothetical protein G3I34_23010 [Streptomyces sp. SID8014]|uniref:hypothetical protein n=1 Tax=Streptomyces sp. SID8014 TaxID=2706097 RepID=UPI0013B7CC21|nr:hypothetical protein [Streptomyces sp. SID8014]NEC15085.1 hypothetical protein [Streptomyces sp. SID8014]
MTTRTENEKPVSLSKGNSEETAHKSRIPAWAKLPEWTPTALIGSACFLMSCAAFSALYTISQFLIALHESSIPWWGAFWVYCLLGGALFRASKEFATWIEAARSRWGVFTRWASSLV